MKKVTEYIFLIAILLIPATVFGQSPEFIDAIRAYQSGDFEVAGELLTSEIAANPSNDAAYFYLAKVEAMTNPASPKIEDYFKKALELSPENFWYKYFLALYYAETDRTELTTVLMEELIEANPKDKNLYLELAELYLSQRETDKALSTLDKIEKIAGKNELLSLTKLDLRISADPNSEKEAYKALEEDYKEIQTPMMAVTLADYKASMFEDSLALSLYNQALEMDDTYVAAYYGRAHVYQAMRQYDKYFADIDKFLKDKNTNPAIKAEYLKNITNNPQFVRAFMEEIDTLLYDVHTVNPQDTSLNTIAGVYFYQTDRVPFALELLRQNIELYPDSYTLALQYLMVLYYNRNWDAVISESAKLLAKDPKDVDVRQLRAIAYALSEQVPEAISEYEIIKKQSPKDSAIVIMTNISLGDLYFQNGDFKNAEKCFKQVLKIDSDNINALNNYAYYLSLEGKKLKKAKEMSRRTIDAEPDNPTYIDTYAWILHLLGQDVEAKAMFKHAMLYGGKENADVLDHYAEVLYCLKEYDLAFIYWDQAKALDSTLGIEEKIAERKASMTK